MGDAKQAIRRDMKRPRARTRAGKPMVAPLEPSGPERDTMQAKIYRTLARGLMSGMFKPGEAVTLRTLATRLSTSAIPLREALSRLIAQPPFVLLPNRA